MFSSAHKLSARVCVCMCVAETHSHHRSCFHSREWPQRHSAVHDRSYRWVHWVQDPHLLTLAAPEKRTEASPSCQQHMLCCRHKRSHTADWCSLFVFLKYAIWVSECKEDMWLVKNESHFYSGDYEMKEISDPKNEWCPVQVSWREWSRKSLNSAYLDGSAN